MFVRVTVFIFLWFSIIPVSLSESRCIPMFDENCDQSVSDEKTNAPPGGFDLFGSLLGISDINLYLKAVDYEKAEKYEDAFEIYLYLAKKKSYDGRVLAQHYVASAYKDGKGVEKDIEQSIYWFTKAASNSRVDKTWASYSMNSLGMIYMDGINGIRPDQYKAIDWFLRSASFGEKYSMQMISNHYEPDPEYYYYMHKDQFDFSGKYCDESPRDIELLVKDKRFTDLLDELECRVKNMNDNAYRLMFSAYFNGSVVEKNVNRALAWLYVGAVNNDRLSQHILGNEYAIGKFTPVNIAKATYWYKKALSKIPGAANDLGLLLRDQYLSTGDNSYLTDAIRYFEYASDSGSEHGMFNLADMYFHGTGVEIDKQRALVLYKKAANKGFELAVQKLSEIGKLNQPTNVSTGYDDVKPNITLANGLNYKTKDRTLVIKGSVSDDSGIAGLYIANGQVNVDDTGEFEKQIFVAIGVSSIEVRAVDLHGNTSLVTLKVEREREINTEIAKPLSPPRGIDKIDPDSIALLIGVGKYDIVPDAPWSDSDAAHFYDYARNVLGVAGSRIRLLQEDEAEGRDIWKTLTQWLPALSEPNKSNIYIFFAGHGLASADGEAAYLVPWDGDPDMLERTAILRQEMIDGLKKLKPASVVMFMDTCYSGTAKGGKKTLVADARALRVVRKDRRSILPENFTLFSAAANDEIASSHPTLKHGLFSYWMMRGLGGEADGNSDNKITAGELHSFVGKNVERDAVSIGRKQHPQLVGDAERVVAAW